MVWVVVARGAGTGSHPLIPVPDTGAEGENDASASSRHSALNPPVHWDENNEERSSTALKAHTLAQRDRGLVNPEVKGEANNKPTQPTNPPLP